MGGSNSSGGGKFNSRMSCDPVLAPASPVHSSLTHPKTAPLQTPPLALETRAGRAKADVAMATVLLGLTTPTHATPSALWGGRGVTSGVRAMKARRPETEVSLGSSLVIGLTLSTIRRQRLCSHLQRSPRATSLGSCRQQVEQTPQSFFSKQAVQFPQPIRCQRQMGKVKSLGSGTDALQMLAYLLCKSPISLLVIADKLLTTSRPLRCLLQGLC